MSEAQKTTPDASPIDKLIQIVKDAKAILRGEKHE